MKRLTLTILVALLTAAPAFAGHKCMPAMGLSDLTTTTCAINSANTGSGRKYTTRDCTDANNGFSYEFTWPEGGVTGVDLDMYTIGQDGTGNVSWDMQCVCVTQGAAEEYAAPTFSSVANVVDADAAAGDLNRVQWTGAASLSTKCAGAAALDKCIVIVNRIVTSDTDTQTQPVKEICAEWP